MSPAWRENSTGNLGDDRFRHLRPGSLYFTESTYAVNAAIRRAGLEGKRHMNPVVDGQLVPRALKAKGHGAEYLSGRRRGRRAVNYVDPEPDDDDEDLELGPPDDGDGWD